MSETSQRAAERVRVDAFVKIQGDAGQELVFRTRDLSEGGLFLYTKVARVYPFKVGSTLQLELYDPQGPASPDRAAPRSGAEDEDQAVVCKVVVVRIVEEGSAESATFPTGFGVKIVDLGEPSRQALAAMIARARATGDVY